MGLCAAAYLAAHYVAVTAAVALLVVGLLLHTATEMFASAGEWTASVELADGVHRGKYLSVYRLWPALAVLVCTGAIASAAVTSQITVDKSPPMIAGDAAPRQSQIPMTPSQ
jgi:hypothetical protein